MLMIYISLLLTILQIVGYFVLFYALSLIKIDVVHALGIFITSCILMNAKQIVNDAYMTFTAYKWRNYQPPDENNLHV